MPGLSGLPTPVQSVRVGERALPVPLLDLIAAALGGRKAMASAPSPAFTEGESESFAPPAVPDAASQRFVPGLDYKTYSGMSEGSRPEFEDTAKSFDRATMVRALLDTSPSPAGGRAARFSGKATAPVGKAVARAARFRRGGPALAGENVDLTPEEVGLDWQRRYFTPREQALDVAQSIPAGAAEGLASAVGLPRALSDIVARAAGRPSGLEGVLPTVGEARTAMKGYTGPWYEAQTPAGEFANLAGQFIPWGTGGALKGALTVAPRQIPGVIAKWLSYGVGPAAMSQ